MNSAIWSAYTFFAKWEVWHNILIKYFLIPFFISFNNSNEATYLHAFLTVALMLAVVTIDIFRRDVVNLQITMTRTKNQSSIESVWPLLKSHVYQSIFYKWFGLNNILLVVISWASLCFCFYFRFINNFTRLVAPLVFLPMLLFNLFIWVVKWYALLGLHTPEPDETTLRQFYLLVMVNNVN